ncbi:MAG: hypothetical protein M1814_003362 [Vezdaea aestivalis]|nr:MAG: hypothetical protein M1814_003362 [Vezdaea aestivalis]
MAENVPGPANANSDASRGLPYYEQLKESLRQLIAKKRALDRNSTLLEERIYKFEGHYLEETSSGGNIIKGFDNYIKGSSGTSGTGGAGTSRKKTTVSDGDRVFSRSSSSFNSTVDNSPGATAPSSARTTPSHAPTPTAASFSKHEGSDQPASNSAANAGNKGTKRSKKKAEETDGDNDSRSNKRIKVNFGNFGS